MHKKINRILRNLKLNDDLAGRMTAFQIALQITATRRSNWRNIHKSLISKRKKELTIIISSQRSGTNLLCGILYQYPSVFSNYEILNETFYPFASSVNTGSGLYRFLQSASCATDDNIIVSKLFHEHIIKKGLDWVDLAKHFNEFTIFHLVRRDLLAQYASLVAAKQSGEWETRSDKTTSAKHHVNINLADFRKYSQKSITSDCDASLAFKNHPNYFRFSYEEFVLDPVTYVCEKLAPRIGVNPFPDAEQWSIKPAVKLEDRIENWSEISSELPDEIRYNPTA